VVDGGAEAARGAALAITAAVWLPPETGSNKLRLVHSVVGRCDVRQGRGRRAQRRTCSQSPARGSPASRHHSLATPTCRQGSAAQREASWTQPVWGECVRCGVGEHTGASEHVGHARTELLSSSVSPSAQNTASSLGQRLPLYRLEVPSSPVLVYTLNLSWRMRLYPVSVHRTVQTLSYFPPGRLVARLPGTALGWTPHTRVAPVLGMRRSG
jgi:hypothetical protein